MGAAGTRFPAGESRRRTWTDGRLGTTGDQFQDLWTKGESHEEARQRLVKFLKNEDGPTAVEYAVMLALIIVVCIGAITTLGTNANNTFSYVAGVVPPPARDAAAPPS